MQRMQEEEKEAIFATRMFCSAMWRFPAPSYYYSFLPSSKWKSSPFTIVTISYRVWHMKDSSSGRNFFRRSFFTFFLCSFFFFAEKVPSYEANRARIWRLVTCKAKKGGIQLAWFQGKAWTMYSLIYCYRACSDRIQCVTREEEGKHMIILVCVHAG